MDALMILKHTHIMEIIHQVSIVKPYGYVDSDYTGDITTQKLVIWLAIILTGAHIAYKFKSQPTIDHIVTEDEFTDTTDCSKIAPWLRNILNEVGVI